MSDENAGCGCLFIIAVLGGIGYGIYSWADSQNYVPHSVETTITAKPNWLVGESKECQSEVDNYAALAKKYGGVSSDDSADGYTMAAVSCDDGENHRIKITFYGKKYQPEHRFIKWSCTRETDSFTCRQTGAE